jgi:hypothetical protein
MHGVKFKGDILLHGNLPKMCQDNGKHVYFAGNVRTMKVTVGAATPTAEVQ